MSNYRIYVEKKEAFRVEAKSLQSELNLNLGLNLKNLRYINVYDLFGFDKDLLEKSRYQVFGEIVTDTVSDTLNLEGKKYIAIEYLPGQFDQRASSAIDCVKLIEPKASINIRSGKIVILDDNLDDNSIQRVKKYLINAVEAREKNLDELTDLETAEIKPVNVLVGFTKMDDSMLNDYCKTFGLAMNADDLKCVVEYFKQEGRDPWETELRILDTYWSDHCRHTTFNTILTDIKIDESFIKNELADSLDLYYKIRKDLNRENKKLCLMDMACIGARYLKKIGKLDDLEESEENNACSIFVTVDVDGKDEKWLLQFKNETHNHPTEIEPFGGAATCLGGAIRDPLSGRGYVYQAMRVTGAADPTVSLKDTLKGKLPQRKITTGAAHGYSSYGNQIGLATGLVDEVYHPNYVAKRMEIGAVMGAAPRKNVIRENSDPGDLIILMGGRTGRDGCGGATGSSKAHKTESIETCGAEVQKGNAPTERKLQRLFRREEVSKLIKKCNDFGAGGVSVAIGELADGLRVDLDKVPKKYAGLDGTELAISESQERMAIVIDPKDKDAMLKFAEEENLEAVVVAEVTKEPRLVLSWRGKEIVNLKRDFLDTNGAHQEAEAYVAMPSEEGNYFKNSELYNEVKDLPMKEAWLKTLSNLNVCSKKGLVEMFDSSIGASTVTMPYGGKYQMSPIQTMIAKLPVLKGKCDTVTMMSYGYDPYLSSWSPYHGSIYSILTSVAKIAAVGGDTSTIRFTFQEYFRRLGTDKKNWGEPIAALLGAYDAQMKLGLPSIGGKDSMSGTFNEINVPPTLVSFAVNVAKAQDVVTTELKKAGNQLVKFVTKADEYELPDYEFLKKQYAKVTKLAKTHVLESSYAIGFGGILEAVSKMAFGNQLGVTLKDASIDELVRPEYGAIVAEVSKENLALLDKEGVEYIVIGEVTDTAEFKIGTTIITMEEALNAWCNPLEKVFPTRSSVAKDEKVETNLYDAKNIIIAKNKIARPKVFIPVFPGTNCEYDTMKAFEAAGADVQTTVFMNLTEANIRDSIEAFVNGINQAQILMFPGGFSAGDEPDGSGKFIATAFRNERIKEAVDRLLKERDGLALGICNGFQAVIKLGLVPYGEITPQKEDSPTLAMNNIGRHISKSVYTKVVSNKSPWLQKAELGGVYSIPASHGEGRFVASEEWIKKLAANGQIATQYVDVNGNATMNEDYNPNGSFMAIEGITSPDGRVLGKMCHSERRGDNVAINISGNQDQMIFESGVNYFK